MQVAKYFDNKSQIDKHSEFAKKIVSAETIFESFLLKYNPSFEQQDACDFLACLLDQLHEELKKIYVPQYNKASSKLNLKSDGDWSEIKGYKSTSVQQN